MAGAPAGRRLAPIGALAVSIGQHSERGCKELNQDFHGACIPAGPLLGAKGIVVALADGIGSSAVSGVAAEAAVRSLLDDYYCTPDAWSVRRAAHRVLAASNSWLHAQTRRSPYRYEKDLGYVCTLSALVLRSRAAHVFHVGHQDPPGAAGNPGTAHRGPSSPDIFTGELPEPGAGLS